LIHTHIGIKKKGLNYPSLRLEMEESENCSTRYMGILGPVTEKGPWALKSPKIDRIPKNHMESCNFDVAMMLV
jgi:hypothetical protein